MYHSMTQHLIRSLLHSDPSRTTGSTPPSLTPSTAANPRTMPSRFDASMIAATVVLLSSLFFFSFVYMCVRSRSSSYSSNSFSVISYRTRGRDLSDSIGPTKRASATSAVGSLRMFVYDVAAAKEPVECAVCLGGLRDKDSVKMIPCCGHVFHQQCIDRWFDRHVSCPLCRSTVLQLLPSVKSCQGRLKEVERSDPGGSVSRGG